MLELISRISTSNKKSLYFGVADQRTAFDTVGTAYTLFASSLPMSRDKACNTRPELSSLIIGIRSLILDHTENYRDFSDSSLVKFPQKVKH